MYEKYYRFTGSPFRLTPDHRFFFRSSVHKKALSYLQYGLQQGEGFIVITGKVGTGKSTLVSQLLADLDTKQFVAAPINTTQIGADDVLQMILSAFNQPPQSGDKAASLRALEGFLKQQAALKKRVLLVVDEAQNLPLETLEELRMLSNFVSGGHPLFQCFLVGQPQFDIKLADPRLEQIRQRVIASYSLEPMSGFETQEYIEHRLHRVGWVGRPTITGDAYARIYAETEGTPRRINTLCNRILLYGAIEGLHTIDVRVVDAVIADQRTERPGEGANAVAVQSVPARSKQSDRKTSVVGNKAEVERRLQEIESTLRQHERALRTLLNSAITVVSSMTNGAQQNGAAPVEQDDAGG